MQSTLTIAQIIVSALLLGTIIVQVKGTGFGRVWGSINASTTRRGLERLIFRSTFVLAFAFILISVLSLII
ncbi:preprotein translocase subunit SecG [Candidatus Woesebacteria bacterium]|nr:preprotein translocase subunit SecG [Candidatus Woesebacteria bacterium]QQG47182.1 MAG: preprotein translocase subunit SecG [Candidatus Woesebacteria bacterium]